MKYFMVPVFSKRNKSMCWERDFFLDVGGSALYISINVNLTNDFTFKTPEKGHNAYFLINFLKAQIMLIFFYISTRVVVL